jgi:uncharacterized protein (DUF486 family)
VTGQHLLLLLWTLWLVFALLSMGDLLGVILALVFGLLGAALVLTGLASWRGYVIAWLIVHVLVAGYAVAVLRGWLHPASGRLGLRTLWSWPQTQLRQTIFGSVSVLGLVSVLYLRPTVPWKYLVDIPLMILVVIAVVGVEYVLLSRRFRRPVEQQDPVTPEQQDPVEPERNPAGPESGAGLAPTTGDTMEGKVVPAEQPPDGEAENRKLIHGIEFRLGHVEDFLRHQQAHDGDVHAPAHSALDSGPGDAPMWFYAADPVRSWAESDELPAGAIKVEFFRTARLTTRLEGSNGMADGVVNGNGMAGRVVGITLERRTVAVSPEPDETVSRVITKAVETLSHEIETCAAAPGPAQAISPSNWEVVSARWVQAGSAGVSTGGRTVDDLGASLNSILRHEPVQRVFSWNAPGSAAAVIGKDAETKEILNFAGIVVGTRSGQAAASSACVRSLARDDFTRSLAAGIARTLGLLGLSGATTSPNTHRLAG